MANKMTIESHFKAVKEAGYETVQEARQVWMEVGQETAHVHGGDAGDVVLQLQLRELCPGQRLRDRIAR